jgi:Methyltransferase TRM13
MNVPRAVYVGGRDLTQLSFSPVLQASIVGHMQRRGLLDEAAITAYLEFGAGAGYLSTMLAACCEARKLVLIDSGSFRLKADRCGQVLPNMQSTHMCKCKHTSSAQLECTSCSALEHVWSPQLMLADCDQSNCIAEGCGTWTCSGCASESRTFGCLAWRSCTALEAAAMAAMLLTKTRDNMAAAPDPAA